MNKIYSYILIMFLGVLSMACSSDIDDGDVNGGDTPMAFTFSAPAPAKTATGVPALQDGSVINDLAVFFCKPGTQEDVVAYRCITGLTDQTLLKFDMSKTEKVDVDWVRGKDGAQISKGTRHSINIEPPTKGEYIIYAVANFTKYANIKSIIDAANGNLTNPNLNTQLTALKAHKISSNTNHLRDASKPMLLTVRDVILIGPGQNIHTSHLLRANTRIRVTVRNESYKYPLKVNDIQFTNISCPSIPMFVTPGYEPAEGTVTPNIKADGTSSVAITPFDTTKEIAINGSTEGNTAVVFDGYILESSAKDEGRNTKYSFKINVTGVGADISYIRYKQGTASADISDTRFKYLIKVRNENNYMYVDETDKNVIKKPLTLTELTMTDESCRYIWEKNSASLISFYLDTKGITNKYMDGKNAKSPDVTFADSDRKLFTQQYSICWGENDFNTWWSSNWRYITRDIKWAGPSSWDASKIEVFEFIQLTEETVTSQSTPVDAPFVFTKQVNNKSEIVRSIYRNDFYDIFINVRYNEKSKSFDFSVEGWDDKNLEIEFN